LKKLLKVTLTVFFTTILLLGFAIPVNMPNGTWYQQFFPNLNGRVISDITFIDSLNGFAVTRLSSTNDTNYILKSTNSGDNWNIVYRQYTSSIAPFNKVKFLNKDTGFVGGNNLLKTTNAGINWIALPLPAGSYSQDFFALNEDTIWFADFLPFDGGLFRSTNKGLNWERQYDAGPAPNPDHVYMYNGRIGFMTRSSNLLYKTTNSGINWFTIPGGTWRDIYFVDSLTGWKANISMNDTNFRKTTDGGTSWFIQKLPIGGNITSTSGVSNFNNINKDTIWAVGGAVSYGANGIRAIIYRSTNSGNNWLYQITDTNYGIPAFTNINFINKLNGWVYSSYYNQQLAQIVIEGLHTTNGGDTTFLVGLQQLSSQVPKDFMLFQNYPNPFNPQTNVKYSVKRETSNVKLIVYDIQGRVVTVLVNQKQNAGTYEIDFSGNGFASGVYFYKITVQTGKEVFSETKKMLMIK